MYESIVVEMDAQYAHMDVITRCPQTFGGIVNIYLFQIVSVLASGKQGIVLFLQFFVTPGKAFFCWQTKTRYWHGLNINDVQKDLLK